MKIIPKKMLSQLLLLLFVLSLGSSVIYSLLISRNQAYMLLNFMKDNAVLITKNMADTCSHHILIEDYSGMDEFLAGTANQPHISEIRVYDTDKNILSDIKHEPGQKPQTFHITVSQDNNIKFEQRVTIEGESMTVWEPIEAGSRLAWIRVIFSTREIEASKELIWKDSLLISGFMFIMIFILAVVSVQRPVKSIMKISDFARKLNIKKGEELAVVSSTEEIQNLCESLNYASRELYQAELSLRIEREKLETILENAGEGIISIDGKKNIAYMNSVSELMTGLLNKEAAGKNLFDLLSRSDPDFAITLRDQAHEAISKSFIHEQTSPLSLKAANGGEIMASYRIAPLAEESSKTAGAVIVIRDMTEYIKAEAHRIMIEEQLIQSQKMEAVGHLAGGVAHDFNNILTAIMGYIELLTKNISSNESARTYLNEIHTAAQRGSGLTRSLLAFSRREIFELKNTGINEMIQGMGKMLRRLIGEDIDLKIRLHKEELFVMADIGQLEQALMNLTTNARDAMPDGGILSIETGIFNSESETAKSSLFERKGVFAVITVSDTGTGMNDDMKHKIFEPFFTTKEVGKGTGLGLSIVYSIIKQHDGLITVYSEPDTGSVFKLYIPLCEKIPEPARQIPAGKARGGSETILLTEDEDLVRKTISLTLRHEGYNLIEAINGRDAKEKFLAHQNNIDLIITDVIMPYKNGKELYDEVKAIKPELKVLFISGYTDDILRTRGVHNEKLNFLSKPFTSDSLINTVREILDMR